MDNQTIDILIVDDNKAFVNALKMLVVNVLIAKNIEIDVAFDGLEAAEKIVNKKYNYIFMDVNLPYLSGEAAVKIIRRNLNWSTMVIAVSFDNAPDTERAMLSVGANIFLNKEKVSFDELMRIFQRHNTV